MLQSEYRIWFKKKVSSSPQTEPELKIEHCAKEFIEEQIEEQMVVPEDCVNILKNSSAPPLPEKYKLQPVNELTENVGIEDLVQTRIERELEEFKAKQAIDPLSYKQFQSEKTFSIAKATKLPSSVKANIPIVPSEEPIQEPVDLCLLSSELTSKTTSKLPFDFQEPLMVNEILNSLESTNATKRIKFSKILNDDQKPASRIASPNNKSFTSPKVKQPKSSSRNFSRIFWPVFLVSNLFLLVGQIHLFHSLNEFKKFDNKRFERLQAKMNLYQQKFQKQLDEISSKGKEIVAPLFAINHPVTAKTNYTHLSQKPKQIVSQPAEGFANSTLQLPQYARPKTEEDNKVEDSVANSSSDEGFSVIKPREEAEKQNQFSILTDSEYTQYQTTVKRRQATDKKKASSYSQLFEQSKNLYSKREVKEQ